MSALSTSQLIPTCTDTELVAAVRGGGDRAFEELYSRYRSRIGAYILGIVSDHARAEDIAQEVFISALRRLRATERPIAFKAWIYEIAKNACIDEYRRARRAREVPLEREDDDSGDRRRMLSGDQAPHAAIERKQSLDDLRGAFHGLSESHHRIIVMREFEGLSYSQIGERLGMSRPVVESTLFRARRRLSKEYDELVSGRRCEHVQTLIASGEPKSLLKLGLRERRRLAHHLSHCQACRREARLAGIDDSLFHAPGLAGKIAALLPIPWLRWRRGSGHRNLAGRAPGHSAALLQPLQSLARFAGLVDPSSVIGRAATAAAAVAAALAGLGGGVVVAISHHAPAAPRVAAAVISRAPSSAPAPGRSASSRARAATQPNTAARSRSHAHSAGAGQTGSGRGASATSATPAGASASTGSASHGTAPSEHSPLGVSVPHGSSNPAGSVLKRVTKPVSGVVKKVTQPVSGVVEKVTQPVSRVVEKVTQPVSRVVEKVTQPVSGVVKKLTGTPPLSQLPQKISVPGVGSVTVPKVSVPNPTKLLDP